MSSRRLPVDASSLWEYPPNQLVVRFSDINQFRQISLADRIKKTARQRRIRNDNGITIEKIFEALKEINPIIFIEGQLPPMFRGANCYRTFNHSACEHLSGWIYKNLCETIYKMVCLNRQLTRNETQRALMLSCYRLDRWYENVEEKLNRFFPQEEYGHVPTPAALEIGQEEIGRISNNLNPEVPREMAAPEPTQEIPIHIPRIGWVSQSFDLPDFIDEESPQEERTVG